MRYVRGLVDGDGFNKPADQARHSALPMQGRGRPVWRGYGRVCKLRLLDFEKKATADCCAAERIKFTEKILTTKRISAGQLKGQGQTANPEE
jgi:hypothetical protein